MGAHNWAKSQMVEIDTWQRYADLLYIVFKKKHRLNITRREILTHMSSICNS